MDDESGKSTNRKTIKTGTGGGEPKIYWDDVDRVIRGAGSRDKVKHIEANDQLFVTRMAVSIAF